MDTHHHINVCVCEMDTGGLPETFTSDAKY